MKKILFLIISVYIGSCTKFVEVESPLTSTNADLVFANDANAIATLNSIYTTMSQQGLNDGPTSLSLYAGLSADEISVYENPINQVPLFYYKNSLTSTNTSYTDYWTSIYTKFIYQINSCIEGLTASDKITPAVKQQLLGEAFFMRAFNYFYLVNLYGDVPLILTTDYKANSVAGRTPVADVYKQIIADLLEAKNLLNENYLDPTLLNASEERVCPNKSVATALLARVYLYNSNWNGAEEQATAIIANKNVYDTVGINQVFAVNSKESIWQLQSVNKAVSNTNDAMIFILPEEGPNNGSNIFYLNPLLVKDFESGDVRLVNWINHRIVENDTFYYPTKYKVNENFAPVTERSAIMRIAEQYLIRAEARLMKNDISESLDDLNVIRARARLQPFNDTDPEKILEAILQERRTEFFSEWGHRWFDLKRLDMADEVLSVAKQADWQPTDKLYPIPYMELLFNINLKDHQNDGY